MKKDIKKILEQLGAQDRSAMTTAYSGVMSEYLRIAQAAGVQYDYLDPEQEADPEYAVDDGGDGRAVMRIQGPLDGYFNFSAKDMIAKLDELKPRSILLLIESPGGFVAQGMALYADLRARARDGVEIIAETRGLVASAATLPYLAADERVTATGSQLMIHYPMAGLYAFGRSKQIMAEARKLESAMNTIEEMNREILNERAGIALDKAGEMLDAETWFSPKQALENKIATKIVEDGELTETHTAEQRATANAMAQRIIGNFMVSRSTKI